MNRQSATTSRPGDSDRPTIDSAAAVVAGAARPIIGAATDYDAMIDLVGTRRIVLIGEASHGTHDFYRERARITRRLIDECGFTAVAVEADWPDAYRVNRYVMGLSHDRDAQSALSDFRRFPAWMWRNRDVVEFVEWLHARNGSQSAPATKAGFYGLDLYSLQASIESVIGYLDRVDPAEANRARERYACFDHVGAEGSAYGYALAYEAAVPCENEVVAQLVELRRRAESYLRRDGWVAEDELFFAEQNARVVRNAEEYYQQMYRSSVSSWNLRDRHMAGTLDALLEHLDRRLGHAKVVVWEHNSHVGDARATSMAVRGELNVGQLARQRYGNECLIVGLTTYDGRVTAASAWGHPAERKHVRPALPESQEALLHEVGEPGFWFATRPPLVQAALRAPRLERAIGVIYRPERERQSHYFEARLPDQFDAVVHLDRTRALVPLERTATWDRGEPPETFPTGV
jgi:erythromycin esterase-like protein